MTITRKVIFGVSVSVFLSVHNVGTRARLVKTWLLQKDRLKRQVPAEWKEMGGGG